MFIQKPFIYTPKQQEDLKMIITHNDLYLVSNWEEQVASLIRDSWSSNGICYFPYLPMTEYRYWREEAPKRWNAGLEYYRFYVNNSGEITACAAIVHKSENGGYWEIGRFNSRPNNPRGVMQELVTDLMKDPVLIGERILCETTQAHTSSQFIAKHVGLRFAGYGLLTIVNGVAWDILYFDNSDLEDFDGNTQGVVNNVFGVERGASDIESERLVAIPNIISIERWSGFPPKYFHILECLEKNIRRIVENNT